MSKVLTSVNFTELLFVNAASQNLNYFPDYKDHFLNLQELEEKVQVIQSGIDQLNKKNPNLTNISSVFRSLSVYERTKNCKTQESVRFFESFQKTSNTPSVKKTTTNKSVLDDFQNYYSDRQQQP